MISSQEALQIILNNTQDFGIEEIPFLEATGRVLKEDIKADRDFPPFNSVRMDGIAISFNTFAEGNRIFRIEGIQAAGSAQLTLKNTSNCLEVMTGAVLPHNADTVIRYEDLHISDGHATITIDTITEGQNVHEQGRDRKTNDVLIKKNCELSPAEIGVLATVGKTSVIVAKQPKIIIVSTGDELVEVAKNPLKHQIRRSNVYTLVSLLEQLGIQTETAHIPDEKLQLKKKIAQFLKSYDALLFSGAVSKGKFDFLPEVLNELGVVKTVPQSKTTSRKTLLFWCYRTNA